MEPAGRSFGTATPGLVVSSNWPPVTPDTLNVSGLPSSSLADTLVAESVTVPLPRLVTSLFSMSTLSTLRFPAMRIAQLPPQLDMLVAAGVSGILNFAPVTISVPPTVSKSSVDLAIELEQLSFDVVNRAEKN